jgi:hypothetical protein
MYIVRRGEAADDASGDDASADEASVVKQALEFAVAMRDEPKRWALDFYAMGLDAYDQWIRAIEDGRAGGMGTAYNAAVWAECRHFAAEFLAEAQLRLRAKSGALPAKAFNAAFEAALEAYGVVADNLRAVSDLFPFMVPDDEKERNVSDPERCGPGLLHLRSAKLAEQDGLNALEQIAAAL